MLRTLIAAVLTPFRRPRLFLFVAIWQAIAGLAVSLPYALMLHGAVPTAGVAETLGVHSSLAFWNWFLLWNGQASGLARSMAVFIALVLALAWQFVVGGIYGTLFANPERRVSFRQEGARLWWANCRITALSWVSLGLLGIIVLRGKTWMYTRIADDPRDDQTLRAVLLAVAAAAVLVLLVRLWADAARAAVVIDRRGRATIALFWAARSILRRPITTLVCLGVFHGGAVGVIYATGQALPSGQSMMGFVLALAVQAVGIGGVAFVRLGLLGAAGGLVDRRHGRRRGTAFRSDSPQAAVVESVLPDRRVIPVDQPGTTTGEGISH